MRYKLLSKKRYKLEVDSVEENNKGKGEKDKGGKQGEAWETRGSKKKNKAAILLPY
jgi:hypothetical protein